MTPEEESRISADIDRVADAAVRAASNASSADVDLILGIHVAAAAIAKLDGHDEIAHVENARRAFRAVTVTRLSVTSLLN